MSDGSVEACAVIICTVTGLTLLGIATDDYIDSKDDYNEYMNTQGVIMQSSYGTYECFKQTGCDKCINASQYDLCETMLHNGITGNCNQNVTECCSEKCFNCKGGTCHQCGRRSPECSNNCYCNDINDSPQCMIISGTCYQASLTVNFMTNFGYRTNVSMVKNCGIGETKCDRQINNCLIQPQGTNCKDNPIRIEQINVGDIVGVIYDPNDPTKLTIGYRGEFTMSDIVRNRFIVGGVLSYIIVCIALVLVVGMLYYMFLCIAHSYVGCCLGCSKCCSQYQKRRREKKKAKDMFKRQKKLETEETKRRKEQQKEIAKKQQEEKRVCKKKEKEKKREAERVKKELHGNTKGWFSSLYERLFSKRGPPPEYIIPTAPTLTGPQLEPILRINSPDYPVNNCELPSYTEVLPNEPTDYLINEAGTSEFDKNQQYTCVSHV